jgi:putative CocE/NonD family hydrolase
MLLLTPGLFANSPPLPPSPADHEFEIVRGFLAMKDGVRLAATYFRPLPKSPDETFPVLFELLPYRKDDSFYQRDYPLYSYFARRGYIVAKVDVRGTGSSEGKVPSREYSDQELDDAVEVIAQLAAQPGSNGKVGMWGISWSGFNALQVAAREPPALGAVLAAHASDNVFKDSVDYVDGSFHVDAYHLQIHHENALPRPPDYATDAAYFEDRFLVRPWFFDYLEHQNDGPYWRANAPQFRPGAIKVPVFLIGALLDGYRDLVPRFLDNLKVPVKAVMGPWNHAWPDDGVPGPNFEWRREAVRFWDKWLKDRETGIVDEPRFAVFVRGGHGPDAALKTTPGEWRYEDWPIRRARTLELFPARTRALRPEPPRAGEEALKYVPSFGFVTGGWWGETTGDMRADDAGSLVFDSPPLSESLEIIGLPKVHLRAAVDAPLATFVVRLEDVLPDGTVSLVTGAALNGAQRKDPQRPEALPLGQPVDVDLEMHFTTWTFAPGHRIRLAVTNAQFPMIWPAPSAMTLRLLLGADATRLRLPFIPAETRPVPAFAPPEPQESRPDARTLACDSWPEGFREVKKDLVRGTTAYEWRGQCSYEVASRHFESRERNTYETRDDRPAESSFDGEEVHRIRLDGGRALRLESRLSIRSDATDFYATFTRRLFENDGLLREKTWEEKVPRQFQ